MSRGFSITSHLRASAEEVWRHATDMASIRKEIMPWMRMTYPPEIASYSLADAKERLGEGLFPTTILLFGVLPIERMELTLTEIGPGYRFVEQSKPKLMREWRHERTIEAEGEGSMLRDDISFAMPIAALDGLMLPGIRAFFGRRHAKLQRLFGSR